MFAPMGPTSDRTHDRLESLEHFGGVGHHVNARRDADVTHAVRAIVGSAEEMSLFCLKAHLNGENKTNITFVEHRAQTAKRIGSMFCGNGIFTLAMEHRKEGNG